MLFTLQQGQFGRRKIPPAVATYPTWNPADKGANIALSNSDRTATAGAGDTSQICRSVQGHASGDRYFEVLVTNTNTNGRNIVIGVSKAGSTLSEFLGASTNGYAWIGPGDGSNAGAIYYNNSLITINARYNFSAGDNLGVLLRQSSGGIWLRKNGAWVDGNGDAGTGPTFSSVASATWHMGCTPYRSGNALTIPTTPTYGIPTSASYWV